MKLTKETKWLCENAKQLEQYSGQWIAFVPKKGVVCKGSSLHRVLGQAKKKKFSEEPFVFHIPSKDELGSPLHFFKS